MAFQFIQQVSFAANQMTGLDTGRKRKTASKSAISQPKDGDFVV